MRTLHGIARVSLAAALLVFLAAGASSAQPPRANVFWQDDPTGRARPRLVEVAADGRLVSAAAAPAAAVFLPRFPLAPGPKPYAALLCRFHEFPDVTPGTREHFERVMGSPEFPSVNHYWTEVTGGHVTLDGSRAFGWYTLPRPKHTYVSPTGHGVNFEELARDCMDAADAEVHFPDYYGIHFVVNGNLDGYLYAGGGLWERDGVRKRYVATYLDGTAADNVGLAAHEVGHNFGLGHTSGPYGATYDSRWDVMSGAGWHRAPGSQLLLPSHTTAWQKHFLGLVPDARRVVADVGTTTLRLERLALPAANGDPLMAVVRIPGGDGYYVLENRGGAHSAYEAGFPEPAVVVHRFAQIGGLEVVDLDGNGDPNDAGAQLTPGETFVDRANQITVRVDGREGSAFLVTATVADRGAVRVAPGPRRREIAFGERGAWGDSASVAVSTPDPSLVVPWRATARSPRLVITGVDGSGHGKVRWTSTAAELAPGTYVDSIAVVAPGVADSVAWAVDTLVVGPAPALGLALSLPGRSDSLVAGTSSVTPFEVQVRSVGPGAPTTAWDATRRAAWIELLERTSWIDPTPRLRFRHVTDGLAPGTYVDTIVVSLANGAAARFVDTLHVLPPLALALAAPSDSATLPQGSPPALDSVYVRVEGPWAASAPVIGIHPTSPTPYIDPDPRPRVGPGWLRFRRAPGALPPGLHVNRLRVALAIDPAHAVELVDTLVVEAAAPRILLSATSRRDSALAGGWVSMDSVLVLPQGPDALTRKWVSTANVQRILPMLRYGSQPYGSGRGVGWLVWQRNLAARRPDGTWVPREPGRYVDTILVRFDLSTAEPARLIDTLEVLGAPTLVVDARSRRAATMVGRPATSRDSAAVGVRGWNVANAAWSATHRRPWNALTTASGTGPGMLRWTRDASGLAPGLYVDTITVTAAVSAGSPWVVFDTLRVWPALVVAGGAERPAATMGAEYADVVRAEGGTGTATLSVVSGALPPGLSLAAATGEVRGVPEAVGEFRFTVRAQSDTFSVERELRLAVAAPALAAAQVLDRLLGDGALDGDRVRYLDLLGNRNGRLDVGDVRAWLALAPTLANDPAARALRAVAADSANTSTLEENP